MKYSDWEELSVLGGNWDDGMMQPPIWHGLPESCLGAKLRLRIEERVSCTARFPWGAICCGVEYKKPGHWRPVFGKIYSINHRGRTAGVGSSPPDIAELLRGLLKEVESR